MLYIAIFGKFDRPGDSENVWDDRCEEGLEDQPIVQLGAWRLYHAECLHLVHLEIIWNSMHSLLLKTIPNFDKFIGQNFAESQTAPNLMVFLSPRSGTPCPVHPSCFTIPIHLIFFDKYLGQWAPSTLIYTTFRLVSQTSTKVALHGKLVTGKPLMII